MYIQNQNVFDNVLPWQNLFYFSLFFEWIFLACLSGSETYSIQIVLYDFLADGAAQVEMVNAVQEEHPVVSSDRLLTNANE